MKATVIMHVFLKTYLVCKNILIYGDVNSEEKMKKD